jgi:hypothetical protein
VWVVRLQPPHFHQPKNPLLPPHGIFRLYFPETVREVNAAPQRIKILRFE